jgi:hypothetical protein
MSQFTAEQEEILRKWGQVANRYERAIHFKLSKEGYMGLKRGVETFLDDPNEKTFEEFWNRLWAAKMGGGAKNILNKWEQNGKTIPELRKLIKEVYDSNEYNQDWEQALGARSTLRELYGKLHIEEYPTQNNCDNYGLEFFGYKLQQSYADFQKVFKEFKNGYQEVVGHATKDTDHEVPINFEIDQLFNIIHKVEWGHLGKEDNVDARDFYELVLVQKNDDLTRVKDLVIYYLKNEKEDHIAHKDEIIKYVQDTQSELVKKGLRTTKGLTTYLTQLKNEGILSIEGLENGYYTRPYQRNYWKISPGPSAKYWNIWREGEFVAIGWDEIDVSNTDIQKQAEQIYPDENAGYTAKQFNYFVHEMKKGDVVLSYGNNQILGIGEVKSDYYFDESAEEYKHRRGVKWIDLNPKDARQWETNLYNKLKTNATIVKLTEGDYSSIVNVKCKYYWVNQTRADEINNKHLQAPVDGIWHHKLMADLMEGDFIFHYYDKRLIGYSNVVEPAYKTEIAGKVEYVSNLSELNRFKRAISLTDIKNYLTKENVRLSKYYPLNPNGEVNQIYLGKLSPKAGEFLLKSHVFVYKIWDMNST